MSKYKVKATVNGKEVVSDVKSITSVAIELYAAATIYGLNVSNVSFYNA